MPGAWVAAGTMKTARGTFALVRLADGRVLAIGNDNTCAPGGAEPSSRLVEVYSPAPNSWAPTGRLDQGRDGFAAVLLRDGRVLVAGGRTVYRAGGPLALATTQLYDPGRGVWSSGPRMLHVRYLAAATVLRDGRVLVAGGVSFPSGQVVEQRTAEVLNPKTGKWTATGSLHDARRGATMYPLPDGGALILGGDETRSVERYDARRGTWSVVATMPGGLAQTTVQLADGSVLLIGGHAEQQAEAQGALAGAALASWGGGLADTSGRQPLLDAVWRIAPDGAVTSMPRLPSPREGLFATVLVDGRVLAAGGMATSSTEAQPEPRLGADAWILDIAHGGGWHATASLPSPVERGASVLLRDGSVLAAGGVSRWGEPSTPWCPAVTGAAQRFAPGF